MTKVLFFLEQRDGKLKKGSFELFGACDPSVNEIHGVVLGSGLSTPMEELNAYPFKEVHIISDESLSTYNGEAYAKSFAKFAKTLKPDYIFAIHSPIGRDLIPRVSQKLDAPVVADCTEISFSGNQLSVRRPVYAGKASAEVEFLGEGVKLLTIRANSLITPEPASFTPSQNSVAAVKEFLTKTIDIKKGNTERPDVSEAPIVVSGGRSLKSSDNFKIIEDLADVLGAAVGASRAAVDAGYRPHRDQVGQTGKVVSPSLYIACGISGAIQHLAGMRTSKTIVAINADPEAPIFQVADYGVVGDLFEVVPLLTQELKKAKET